MSEYFQRRYVPSNITVVATGNYDWDGFIKLVDSHCGSWQAGEAPRENITATKGTAGFRILQKEDLMQEQVWLLSPGPSATSPLTYPASILAMILGDDSGSRFYWSLVDPGLADSADMSLQDCEGTGVFYTLFDCEPGNAQSNLALVKKLLQQVQSEGVTEAELQQAKNKVMARLVRSGERPRGRMNAVGYTWVYAKEYRTLDEELARYQAVTLADIRRVLDEFPLTNPTTLALGPLAEMNNPAD